MRRAAPVTKAALGGGAKGLSSEGVSDMAERGPFQVKASGILPAGAGASYSSGEKGGANRAFAAGVIFLHAMAR